MVWARSPVGPQVVSRYGYMDKVDHGPAFVQDMVSAIAIALRTRLTRASTSTSSSGSKLGAGGASKPPAPPQRAALALATPDGHATAHSAADPDTQLAAVSSAVLLDVEGQQQQQQQAAGLLSAPAAAGNAGHSDDEDDDSEDDDGQSRDPPMVRAAPPSGACPTKPAAGTRSPSPQHTRAQLLHGSALTARLSCTQQPRRSLCLRAPPPTWGTSACTAPVSPAPARCACLHTRPPGRQAPPAPATWLWPSSRPYYKRS